MTEAIAQFGFFIFIGAGLELIYITAPVHELGHYIMASLLGVPAILELRQVRLSFNGLSHAEIVAIVYSGVIFEVTVFALLSIWLSKKHHLMSGISFGVALSAFFTTVMLNDMSVINSVGIGTYYLVGIIALLACFGIIAYRINHYGQSEQVV